MSTGMLIYVLLDDFALIALGALLYSYTHWWFGSAGPAGRRTRVVVNGLAFGGLAVALMVQAIRVGPGVLIDARDVPVALIALFDGWPAGLLAGLVAAAFRMWLGGPLWVAGALAVLVAAAAGSLVHEWARRHGEIAPRHAAALSAVVFLLMSIRFVWLGAPGLALFGRVWPSYVVLLALATGLLVRLFRDVLERERMAELRAVAMLANAAAHEINNPLAVVMGSLGLLGRGLAPATQEARWVEQALEAVRRIRDIVVRMRGITRLEITVPEGSLPPILDIVKSAGVPDKELS
jgi:signal transduction histidine kinase